MTGLVPLACSNRESCLLLINRAAIFDPPQVGQFKNGRGGFYTQDTLNGKTVFVRFEWTRLNTDSPHFEQASEDGGKTWAVNWITDQTRVKDPLTAHTKERDLNLDIGQRPGHSAAPQRCRSCRRLLVVNLT